MGDVGAPSIYGKFVFRIFIGGIHAPIVSDTRGNNNFKKRISLIEGGGHNIAVTHCQELISLIDSFVKEKNYEKKLTK